MNRAAMTELNDLIRLYSTPAKTENPAVESRPRLLKVIKDSGAAFPFITARGWLTHHAIPEKDGDFHFYIETEQSAEDADAPMMTCEIQGMNVQPPDSRTKPFKQLWVAGEVEVTGLLRAWPEHLRNSTQPHLFEIHPLLTIGLVGKKPLNFYDRVIWPTGEDEDEVSKSWTSVVDPPQDLTIERQGQRIVFLKTNFQKENYVHLDGEFAGETEAADKGLWLTLNESGGKGRSVRCFALEGSPIFKTAKTLKNGSYRIGGLGGLDLLKLAAATPSWESMLCPVLTIESLD